MQRLVKFQLWIAMAALSVMMLVTVADVVMRHAFNHPISGAYDVTESALVVFVFNGLPAVFWGRRHIVIDLVDTFTQASVARALTRAGDLVSIGALALILFCALSPARQAFDYGDHKLELGLRLWVLWAFAIFGLLGTLAGAFGALMRAGAPEKSH